MRKRTIKMYLPRKRQAVRPRHQARARSKSNNRSGLPLGYLNQLEQRLLETESALYGALTTLRSIGQTTTPVSTKPDTPKQKAALMEEWSGLPLRDWKDMEHWLSVMSDQFSIEPRTERSGYAIPIPVTPNETRLDEHPSRFAWQDGRVTGSLYESHQGQGQGMMASPYFGAMDEVISSPGSSRQGIDDAVGVSGDANAVERSTRAEELSHRNPSLYF